MGYEESAGTLTVIDPVPASTSIDDPEAAHPRGPDHLSRDQTNDHQWSNLTAHRFLAKGRNRRVAGGCCGIGARQLI